MDLGFGKFLEYFREFFGEKLTIGFVALISLTVTAFCVNMFFIWAVIPISRSVSSLMSGDGAVQITGSAMFGPVVAFLAGAILSYIGGRVVISFYFKPKVDRIVKEAETSMTSIDQLKNEVDFARLELFKDIIENGPTEKLKEFVAAEEKRLNTTDKKLSDLVKNPES